MLLQLVKVVTENVQELEVTFFTNLADPKFLVVPTLLNTVNMVLDAEQFVSVLANLFGAELFLTTWTSD